MTLAFSSGTPELPRPGGATPASTGHGARDRLGGRDVRRGLTDLLRRRVPQQEVEDVAQTVLCDALASQTVPSDPEELRRWLCGIARHKIADFHRRSARASARASAEAPEAVAARPTAFEEREVLESLLAEPRTRRDAETMEWLVREHDGERLADIASENGLPAPVVRQRVSRLRRALRSRWAGVFGVLALLAGLSALGVASSDPRAAITPDPAVAARAAPSGPASGSPARVRLLDEVAGDWIVQAVTPNRPLSPTEKRFVDVEAKAATVHIAGDRVELASRTIKIAWRVVGVERLANGSLRVRLVNDAGITDTADVRVRRDGQGPRVDVTLHGARFGGAVSLRRPTH